MEAAPNRQNYVCSWSMGVDGAWSLVKGSGEEAVTVTRVRSEVESAASTQYEVWQLVTTTSRGGVAASCVCEVYQNSPMGNLLLTRVEGYGSAAAQTTTYEYDGLGNMVRQTNPNGHIIEHWYDSTGRVTKTREPWHDDQGTLITTYTYADPEDGRYSSDLAEVKRHVYPAGASTMVTLSTETHTHTISNGVKREEVQTTATGSSQMHLEITETWTDDAPNALDKGRLRMRQAVNGVQTWYTYTSTSSYGALYTITEETRVEGEAVEGQSRRSVQFITSPAAASSSSTKPATPCAKKNTSCCPAAPGPKSAASRTAITCKTSASAAPATTGAAARETSPAEAKSSGRSTKTACAPTTPTIPPAS